MISLGRMMDVALNTDADADGCCSPVIRVLSCCGGRSRERLLCPSVRAIVSQADARVDLQECSSRWNRDKYAIA